MLGLQNRSIEGDNIKKLFLVLLLLVLISACTTERSFLKNSKIRENQPIRTLKIIVVYNDNVPIVRGMAMIDEVSRLNELEVGIKLKVIRCIPVGGNSEYENLEHKDHIIALRQLRSLAIIYGYKDKDYDIVLGFANDPPLPKHIGWAMVKPFGVIEDDYRRYIIFYHPTVKVIRHEIYHAFILTEGHTSRLMGGLSVLNPSLNASWLNARDREEVLVNKWRDFSVRPIISSDYRQDRLDDLHKQFRVKSNFSSKKDDEEVR